MDLPKVLTVADAVLYEGYMLYPYRSTSSKNQARWQFGVLGPPGASQAGLGEEPDMHVECLLRPSPGGTLTVRLRFLQLQARAIEAASPSADGLYVRVDRLQTGQRTLVPWDEAVEQTVVLGPFTVTSLADKATYPVEVAGGDEIEHVVVDGATVGRVLRHREPLSAVIEMCTSDLGTIPRAGISPPAGTAPSDGGPYAGHPVESQAFESTLRLSITVANSATSVPMDHHEATMTSLLGAHLVLEAQGGAFISLLEPPDELKGQASACQNRRCWPVLVGENGATDALLVSPIILYDYPAVAEQSAGPLFDSTEIDEILTLRVMTLTDEEKAAARATDPAAAAIIDRCDSMSPEQLQELHGILRQPRSDIPEQPWWDPGVDASVSPSTDVIMIDGVAVSKGSSVRLHPRRAADAQDIFFANEPATVTGVFADVDGGAHVAVVLDNDPASDLHEWYGRYLYFAPDEIEPLEKPGNLQPANLQTKEL